MARAPIILELDLTQPLVEPDPAGLSGVHPISFEVVAAHDPAARIKEKSSFILP